VSDTLALLARAEAVRPVESASSLGLPIFRSVEPHRSLFYTPGCVCVSPSQSADRFAEGLATDDTGWSGLLRQQARAAVQERARIADRHFRPECLTVCLNNACNLSCSYCHSEPGSRVSDRLTLDAIAAGAELVAACCRGQERPMYAVFHGGGEPLLEQRPCADALRVIEDAAARAGVGLVRYVATNGVMAAARAGWMARRFDRVGVSCDGPPDWQDHQRPARGGRGTSAIVERTARIVRERGARLLVRTTVTRAGFDQQAEIVGYLLEQLAPEELVIEPVYAAGRGSRTAGYCGADAPTFVEGFRQAQRLASQVGVKVLSSVQWVSGQHGPHCQMLRSVLNLVPGDVATACFKRSRGADVHESQVAIGSFDPARGKLSIDERRIHELRSLRLRLPPSCRGCFNQFHCGGLCPDACPGDLAEREDFCGQFRCRVQRALAWLWIEEAAPGLPDPRGESGCAEGLGVAGALLGNASG
jgi:sulfatase maturation enzyme AslB (radical SAM superfamily)